MNPESINKCPGVRPIGVGEVPRHILVKVILRRLGKDLEEAARPYKYALVKMEAVMQQSMLCG